MAFSVMNVHANPQNSKSRKNNFSISSLSTRQKIVVGIGTGLGIVGIVTYAASRLNSQQCKLPDNCINRYELLTPGRTITPKIFNDLYSTAGADYRFIEKRWTYVDYKSVEVVVPFDEKFINKVMERRFAHLQQCIHHIKLHEDKIRECIRESGLEESTVWNLEAVHEFDTFMDNLVKTLCDCPAAIPNLMLPDKLSEKAFKKILHYAGRSERGMPSIAIGSTENAFNLVSDDITDRILAAFDGLAQDSDRIYKILELFETIVGFNRKLLSDDLIRVLYKGYNSWDFKLFSSFSLPNPYRKRYTYKPRR